MKVEREGVGRSFAAVSLGKKGTTRKWLQMLENWHLGITVIINNHKGRCRVQKGIQDG